MENRIDKKIFIITVVICLMPMIYGLVNYGKLPENIAIHFDGNNQPDGWAPKIVAFMLPVPLALLQVFLCILSDKKMENRQANRKMIAISKFVIPIITVVTYMCTIDIALGKNIDIRKIVCIMIGVLFIVIGNYVPKTKQNIIVGVRTCLTIRDEKKWAKMNRLMGFVFVIGGLFIFISAFMAPIISVISIGVFIAVTIAINFYASFF